MILYVNDQDQIKDVNYTDNLSLRAIEIDDENNPFGGWPVSKICCYMVTVVDRRVTMMTPYVDSRILDAIGQLGNQNESNKSTLDMSLGVNKENELTRDYIAKQFNRLQQILLSKVELLENESLEISDLYPLWEPNKKYVANEILKWGWDEDGFSTLYRVKKDHISQEEEKPGKNSSIYKRIGIDPSGIPIWVKPISDVDAYDKGEKVVHISKVWESKFDNNMYEPGVHGWKEVKK